MVVSLIVGQGDIWWADLGEPVGSAPGYRRPVLAVQGDAFNRMTSKLKWADAPGNVFLKADATGLDRDSVANCSLIVAIDKAQLIERVGKLVGPPGRGVAATVEQKSAGRRRRAFK